jgi:hypothetical protein
VSILYHFADDAIAIGRLSMANKPDQQTVFDSLKDVSRTAAPYSTAAPKAKNSIDPKNPKARTTLIHSSYNIVRTMLV